MRAAGLSLALAVLLSLVLAGPGAPPASAAPPGTTVIPTPHSFATLVKRLDTAIEKAGMFAVTRASASVGAERRGIAIPGNMVVGVYRNDFAVRMLAASVPAGIEAPIRFYLSENKDGTTTLRYRTPSALFAPYGGGAGLAALARELDAIFAEIAEAAARP